MIIQSKKILFIHIPKAAGTTISSFFMKQDGKDWYNAAHRSEYCVSRRYGNGHYPYSKYLEQFEDIDFSKYIKFAVVRNPWDRLWSNWRWKWRRKKIQKTFSAQKQVFNDSVEQLKKDIEKCDYDWFLFNDNVVPNKDFHIIPQYLFLENLSREIDDSIEVLRFESLQKDFNRLCTKYKLNTTNLRHLNKSNLTNDYHKIYSNKSKKIVEELYNKDIALFNYKF